MSVDYNTMTTPSLVDLLAQETQKFTQLMADKEFSPEYQACKNTIRQIQAVIESRNETATTKEADLTKVPGTF